MAITKSKANSSHLSYLKKAILTLKVLNADFQRCDMFRLSGAMAYTTLLSIVPSLAVLFAILAAFYPIMGQNNQTIIGVKEFIFKHLATGSGEVVVNYLEGFVEKINKSRIGVMAFASLLLTLILLLRQIELALNKVWEIYEERNFFSRFVYFWTFLTLGVFVGGFIFAVVSQVKPSQFINYHVAIELIADLVRYLTYFLGGLIFFFTLYKVVPNTFVANKQAMVGATVASVGFYLASNFYGSYVVKYTNYTSIYGTLAALPMFLLWLYILWVIIFCGAVISWRVGRGFQFEETSDLESHIFKRIDPAYAEIKAKSVLPLVILLTTHLRFRDGSGTNIEDLADLIKLPKDWLSSALVTLEKNSWIHQARMLDTTDIVDKGTIYYPTRPPQTLTLKELITEISLPAELDFSDFFTSHEAAQQLNKILHQLAKVAVSTSNGRDPLSKYLT